MSKSRGEKFVGGYQTTKFHEDLYFSPSKVSRYNIMVLVNKFEHKSVF